MTRRLRQERGWQDYGKLQFHKKPRSLPIQVSVTVPSTKYNTMISDALFKKRISETKRKMVRLFGGHTTVQATGGDGIVEERNAIVTAYTDKVTFQRKKGGLIQWVEAKKRQWQQRGVSFNVENDLYIR